MASRCKQICEAIALVILILDVGVGWFNVHDMYMEINEPEDTTLDKGNNNGEPSKSQTKKLNDIETCPNPLNYWIAIVTFEFIGTLLAVVQGYYICREIIQDKRLQKESFNGAFALVVLIYLLSVFPATLTEILYRDSCVCKGLFLIDDTKHWRRDFQHLRRDLRELSKTFLDGVAVTVLQLIIHAPQIYGTSRKVCESFSNIVQFCKLARDDSGPNKESSDEIKVNLSNKSSSVDVDVADNENKIDNAGSTAELTEVALFEADNPDMANVSPRKESDDAIDVNLGKGYYLVISFILTVVFIVLFFTEVYYIFCNEE